MITNLAHHQFQTAKDLHRIWQRSYPLEAKLIGVVDFPPLNRTLLEFQNAKTRFVGLRQEGHLVAALEYEFGKSLLSINSLVVDPDFLRKGYGKKMMEYILGVIDWQIATIETGEANVPAIRLYDKLGFEIYETYSAQMNISKVKMHKIK